MHHGRAASLAHAWDAASYPSAHQPVHPPGRLAAEAIPAVVPKLYTHQPAPASPTPTPISPPPTHPPPTHPRARSPDRLTVRAVPAVMPQLRAEEAGPLLGRVGAVARHVALSAALEAPDPCLLVVSIKVSAGGNGGGGGEWGYTKCFTSHGKSPASTTPHHTTSI